MKVEIVHRRRIVRVRDEAHARRLLRGFEPGLSEGEIERRARAVVEGGALLVLDDDFEVLDAAVHDDPRLDPGPPLDPVPPGPLPPQPGPQPGPEPEVTWFEARLVDLHGVPLAGVEVTWANDGNRERLTTDGDGVVRLEEAVGAVGDCVDRRLGGVA